MCLPPVADAETSCSITKQNRSVIRSDEKFRVAGDLTSPPQWLILYPIVNYRVVCAAELTMQIPYEDRARGRSRPTPSVGRCGTLLLLTLWTSAAWAGAARTEYPRMLPIERYLMSDQASEIALARTAAPKAIADKATVMTLGKDGYETAVKGTNGFVCLIFR